MKFILLILSVLLSASSYSQSSERPVEVTPAIEKIIREKVDKEIAIVRKHQKSTDGAIENEFELDTMRAERYMREYMKYDFSTAGMRSAQNGAANEYDRILNKYYRKWIFRRY